MHFRERSLPRYGLATFLGSATAKRWICQIEADIHGSTFGIWSSRPEEAVELATTEVWRRVPDGSNDELQIDPEWYERDARVLASVFLAGDGSGVEIADILGATRRASTPSVFMNRSEFGWAVSSLIGSGLLAESGHTFTPNERACELWSSAAEGRPTINGDGCTRSLLREMQTSELASDADVRSWTLSDAEYLKAIHAYIERTLSPES
jgi:hypothetical protein